MISHLFSMMTLRSIGSCRTSTTSNNVIEVTNPDVDVTANDVEIPTLGSGNVTSQEHLIDTDKFERVTDYK